MKTTRVSIPADQIIISEDGHHAEIYLMDLGAIIVASISEDSCHAELRLAAGHGLSVNRRGGVLINTGYQPVWFNDGIADRPDAIIDAVNPDGMTLYVTLNADRQAAAAPSQSEPVNAVDETTEQHQWKRGRGTLTCAKCALVIRRRDFIYHTGATCHQTEAARLTADAAQRLAAEAAATREAE